MSCATASTGAWGSNPVGVKSHGYDSPNRADVESETISRIDFHNNL